MQNGSTGGKGLVPSGKGRYPRATDIPVWPPFPEKVEESEIAQKAGKEGQRRALPREEGIVWTPKCTGRYPSATDVSVRPL